MANETIVQVTTDRIQSLIYFLLETLCLMIVIFVGYYTINEIEMQVEEWSFLFLPAPLVIKLVA